MAFNLNSKKLADTTTLHLRDPGDDSLLFDVDAKGNPDESKPVTIELYGRASKQYRAYMAKILRKAEKEKDANRGKAKSRTFDEMTQENAQFLATVSIKANNVELNGGPVDSEAAFVSLYADPAFDWIGDQVSAALADNGNFLAE